MALNNYETILIFTDDLTKEEYMSKADVLKKLVEDCSDGSHMKTMEMLGKKKLAYEIKKHTEGWYIVFTYATQAENIASFEKYFRENDDVMKFLTVRMGDDEDEDSEYTKDKSNSVESEQKPVQDAWDLIFNLEGVR